MSRLARDGTAEPISRKQIIGRERGQVNIHSPCLADHEQYWQPYPVDPYSAMCDDQTVEKTKRVIFPAMHFQRHNTLSQQSAYYIIVSIAITGL